MIQTSSFAKNSLTDEAADDYISNGAQVVAVALTVLQTPSPWLKAYITLQCRALWKENKIALGADSANAPEKPSRDDTVRIVEPGKAPNRGKGLLLWANAVGIRVKVYEY